MAHWIKSGLVTGTDTGPIVDIEGIDWMWPDVSFGRAFGRITVQPSRSLDETVARTSIGKKRAEMEIGLIQ